MYSYTDDVGFYGGSITIPAIVGKRALLDCFVLGVSPSVIYKAYRVITLDDYTHITRTAGICQQDNGIVYENNYFALIRRIYAHNTL